MGPLSTPVVLVADTPETREMLMGRSDFDRSAYIIDRFPLFGEFHLNMKTGDGWRNSRGWLKDLLAPQYLHNVAGPTIHSHVTKLMNLWDSKVISAEGKPFSMISDLKKLALDVIVTFHFGNDFKDSALSRQIQHNQQLESSELCIGNDGEVVFPSAPLHQFQQGITEVGDRMAAIYTTKWPPSIMACWARHGSPHYRRFFENKDEVLQKHINTSVDRFQRNKDPESGVDHMVYREFKMSRKAGRQTMFGKQIMIDEVSSRSH